MDREAILDYEVRASWWTPWFPFRELAGSYFAWKVRRKFRRYQASCLERKWLDERATSDRGAAK